MGGRAKAKMNKIQDVSLIRHQIVIAGGINMALIYDDPECPSSVLSTDLTANEREEGRQKTAPAAYRSWLLGRLAAKEATGRLWNLPPATVEVLRGPEGAPQAGSNQRPSANGWVSISHTVGAAAAVASESPVGVDLERLDRTISPRVWRWAFSPEEQEMLYGPDGRFPPELALWCAKEAAAKAWGRGLLNHLNQVRATRADWAAGRLEISWLPDQAPTAEKCFSDTSQGESDLYRAEVQLLVYDEYLVALAEKTEFRQTGNNSSAA